MEIRPLPSAPPDLKLELLETSLERLALTAFPPMCRILKGELFQVIANYTGQSRIPLDRDFANFLHQLVVEGECDVHIYIIRETLNPCHRVLRCLCLEMRLQRRIWHNEFSC